MLASGSSAATTSAKKNVFALDPTNFKLLMNHSDKVTPRFIIARCNCRQRNLQNIQRRTNKPRRIKTESMNATSTTSKPRSYSANLNDVQPGEQLIDEISHQQEQVNEETNKSQPNVATKPEPNQSNPNNINNNSGNKPMRTFDANKGQFKFRHFPNCPVSKLNRLKNMQLAQQTHHHSTFGVGATNYP